MMSAASGVRIERGKPRSQRTRHSLPVGRVDDNLDAFEQRLGNLLADRFGGRAKYENNFIHGCGTNILDRLRQHGAPPKGEQAALLAPCAWMCRQPG